MIDLLKGPQQMNGWSGLGVNMGAMFLGGLFYVKHIPTPGHFTKDLHILSISHILCEGGTVVPILLTRKPRGCH